MIDHVTLRVRDLAAAKAFFSTMLAPLGYKVGAEYPEALGLGAGGKLDFWLVADIDARPQHLAFSAPDRSLVDACYAAALAAGGRDNGPAGLRAEYHPNYYGAFVFDGSGHNVEVVCHLPPGGARKAAKQRMVKGPKRLAKKKMAKGLAKKRMVKGPKG